MENTEVKISKILKDLAISPDLLGYKYLKEAISMVLTDTTVIYSVTKILYPEIAKRFNTLPNRAERAIRHAVEKAAFQGDIGLMHEIFGHTISAARGKPTNTQFIACVAEYIMLTQKS